jgi:hypothetical protein
MTYEKRVGQMTEVRDEALAFLTPPGSRAPPRRLPSRLSIVGAAMIGAFFAAHMAYSSPAPTFEIHDFTPDFWRFWEAAQNEPVERQAQLWQQLYVTPHQAVFNDLAVACKEQWDAAWSRTHYLPGLPPVIPAIRTMVSGLTQQLEQANRRFLKAFPDMRWSGDIYVMASGYCFSGRAQMIQRRSALLFGVDTMAALGQKDLIPGMQHELFHRYHHQFFDYEANSAYPLWTTLWVEGMAQYVSELLNPSASEIDLAHVPAGMVQQVDSRRGQLAADFLHRFESTEQKDVTVYFNDIDSKDALVPARGGYELGVLAVRDLSKQYSIQTIAHWSQAEAKPRLRAALERMSATP